MGFIKVAMNSVGSALHDQWKEVIQCDDMGNDILMTRKTSENEVITNKSRIIVAPGQLAIFYDSGVVKDATAEPGSYTFDAETSPSFFNGEFKASLKDMFERFTFGGSPPREQAVFYFNVKEILDNKFGTPAPVPYKDWGHPLLNPRTNSYTPMRVEVKCFGKYTFRIIDPAKFMLAIGGSASHVTKDTLVEQMRSEVIGSFQNVMNSLSEDEYKIEVLSLPNKTDEIKQIMDENVFDQPIRNRGIALVSFIIESLTLDDVSRDKIDKYEIGGDAYQQKGVLTDAYGKAVQGAATNENGAMNGFLGVGMMNMASGGVFGGVGGQDGQQAPPQQPMPQHAPGQAALSAGAAAGAWQCSKCGASNSGKFCSECGEKKVEAAQCKKCGNPVTGKFCAECGEKVSTALKCSKCGKEGEGKFCAECGGQMA